MQADGRTANRISPLMKMAAARCQELELIFGRGDFVIKHEIPQVTEEELNREESLILFKPGKNMENLNRMHNGVQGLKLESDEEAKVVKAIVNQLTESLIAYQTNRPEGDMETGP